MISSADFSAISASSAGDIFRNHGERGGGAEDAKESAILFPADLADVRRYDPCLMISSAMFSAISASSAGDIFRNHGERGGGAEEVKEPAILFPVDFADVRRYDSSLMRSSALFSAISASSAGDIFRNHGERGGGAEEANEPAILFPADFADVRRCNSCLMRSSAVLSAISASSAGDIFRNHGERGGGAEDAKEPVICFPQISQMYAVTIPV